MIRWIKKNWKDSVWSNVFAAVIFGVLSFIGLIIWNLIKQISFQAGIKQFWSFVKSGIYIPIWLIFIILFLVSFFFVRQIIKKKLKINKFAKSKESVPTKDSSKPIIMECPNSYFAKYGFNSTINTIMLRLEDGILNIWAYVSDEHYRITAKRKFLYLISYATNNGNPFNNPSLARYPNAWAISRITPNEGDNIGIWRFWCNNTTKDLTYLDCNKILSGGWHLFTISWSKSDNYIKFIIDSETVAEDEFKNWPTDFSGNIRLGTWANKANVHYFNSKLGPWKLEESKYDFKRIENYYRNKPK